MKCLSNRVAHLESGAQEIIASVMERRAMDEEIIEKAAQVYEETVINHPLTEEERKELRASFRAEFGPEADPPTEEQQNLMVKTVAWLLAMCDVNWEREDRRRDTPETRSRR